MEIEDDEIIFWKIEGIENPKEKIEKDINEIKKFFKLAHESLITHEVDNIIKYLEEIFCYEIRKFK